MCYTPRISLIAFLIGIVSCIVLLKISYKNEETSKQYKIIAWFLMFVSLMQLYDYIFWTHGSHTLENKIATKMAILTNHIQPILLCILIFYILYSGSKTKFMKNNKSTVILLILYLLIVIPYTINALKIVEYTSVSQKSYPSLAWEWNNLSYSILLYTLFLGILLAACVNNFDKSTALFFSLLIGGTFIFSVIKYRIKVKVGRFWCYFASLSPFLFILLKIFKKD